MQKNQGILVVSFGTSYPGTCAKTIDRMENEIRQRYPELPVYRAWTSGTIRKKLEKRDGIHIPGVEESLEKMEQDGIQKVFVQPTFVLNGIEYDRMKETAESFRSGFLSLTIGAPLLSSTNDSRELVQMLEEEWNPSDDEMVFFMGHGTEHDADFVYAALNFQFLYTGYENMAVGTVEGYPEITDLLSIAKKRKARKVFLAPLMMVAGDHAIHDLAGDDENSWKSLFTKEGYEVECVLKGLGEYPKVRELLIHHLEKIMIQSV